MFQFSGFAFPFTRESPTFSWRSFLIRKSTDQRSFAPPRSLSQLTTSFIASESQGIRHTLLITFFLLYLLIILYEHGMPCPYSKDIMTIFRLIIVFSFNMSKNVWVCRSMGKKGNQFYTLLTRIFHPVVENKGVEPLTPSLQS